MLFPMMGLLFMLFLAGACAALIGAVARRLRWIAFPAAIACVAGSVGAFCMSWGLALGLERLLSSNVGGIGFLSGYALGLAGGAAAGALVMRRLASESRTAHS
jgi:hypothetical protein